MFGFYMQDKGEKENMKNMDNQNNDSAVLQNAAEQNTEGTDEEAKNNESFGFLGRFATDRDYQRQVVKHYVCFPETRDYLNQIRNSRQRIELLMKRQSYRSSVNMDIVDIGIEITEEEQKLARLRAEVSDEISKLNDVRQELVLTKRYVDGMSWEQIAADMCSSIRAVQSIHGRGLPAMEKVLVADGKIEVGASDGAHGYYGHREHSGYHGDYHSDYHSDHYDHHHSNHHSSQKYWQKSSCHPEALSSYSAHSSYIDKGYEEAADKSRAPYGEYEDYEFFSD